MLHRLPGLFDISTSHDITATEEIFREGFRRRLSEEIVGGDCQRRLQSVTLYSPAITSKS